MSSENMPKTNHSCYRNIVSFFHFPFKKLWRSIAIAVRHVTDEVISTWSISNMSRSSVHLKAGHAKLMTSATCLLCSCTLEYPTNHTWDIPQTYEMMHHKRVLQDLQTIVNISRKNKIWTPACYEMCESNCHAY